MSRAFSLIGLVGVAGFEPTTTCPPDRCATRLRYTPSRAWIIAESALQELQDFLEFHPHLADDLRAHGGLLAGILALQAHARATDGVALLVQQAADLADHEHVVPLVVAAVAAALHRLQGGEFRLPVAQHVRLHVAELADFTDREVALGRDRREFAVAAGIKHWRSTPRRPRPAPSASVPDGRSPRCAR